MFLHKRKAAKFCRCSFIMTRYSILCSSYFSASSVSVSFHAVLFNICYSYKMWKSGVISGNRTCGWT